MMNMSSKRVGSKRKRAIDKENEVPLDFSSFILESSNLFNCQTSAPPGTVSLPPNPKSAYVGLSHQVGDASTPSCDAVGTSGQACYSSKAVTQSGGANLTTPFEDITNVILGKRPLIRNPTVHTHGLNQTSTSTCSRDRGGLISVHRSSAAITFEDIQVPGNPFRNLCVRGRSGRERIDEDGYDDIGDPIYNCKHCGAIFWYAERYNASNYHGDDPEYSKCCTHGMIVVDEMKEPSLAYKKLLYGFDPLSKDFLKSIRRYNNLFSFTSMGGILDNSVNDGRSPPTYKIHGENYHLIGSLLPTREPLPCFAQLYIYDTENEIANRLRVAKSGNECADLDGIIVSVLKRIVDENNRLVRLFRYTAERLREYPSHDIRLRLVNRRSEAGRRHNTPQADEVAILIVGDVEDLPGPRDIVIESRSYGLERIDELHVLYLPLQYPFIYTEGEDGFIENVPHLQTARSRGLLERFVTLREYAAYRLHERINESPHLLYCMRLTQQFFVDLFTMVEQYRLKYYRKNQKRFRCSAYKVLDDAFNRGDLDSSAVGKRIVLPPTFTGSARYVIQNYHDAMCICRWAGYPNLFITFTCNPKWREIIRYVDGRNLSVQDRQDIVSRIFHIKLKRFMDFIKKGKMFGIMTAAIYTIEWQNRGLPHAHILVWLENNPEHGTPEFVDKHISAEIPDKDTDPEYYAAVSELMMHGPCGTSFKDAPCMTSSGCSKHFPKKYVDQTTVDNDGFVLYRRRNNGRVVEKNGVSLDNRFVVPHNRSLLLKFRAHINVEYCNRSRSIKYLFKYVHKGRDRVTAAFYDASNRDNRGRVVNEIKQYLDCRYVSAAEAVWRLLGFEINFRKPSVVRLAFHLPDEQSVCWREGASIKRILKKKSAVQTMFTAWMKLNETDEEARKLTYAELPLYYVWDDQDMQWNPRRRGLAFGRLYYVYPGAGELFYLRILLNVVRGCTSFEGIRTYQDEIYGTYREACYARGLLDDDKEYVDAIDEASFWGSEHMLRTLFVNLLVSECVSSPDELWNKCWEKLSADLEERYRRVTGREELTLTEFELKNMCLHEIEKLLQKRNRTLKKIPCMPFPQDIGHLVSAMENQLVADELAYDREKLKDEHREMKAKLNCEQCVVYETVMEAVKDKKGGVFFLYGYGGTGKTFVWNTLSAAVRCTGGIVLNVASSGIASLLLPGGRTAHSRFAIPLDVIENSTCNISKNTALAELITKMDLIVWDEAPMMNRHCSEALDKTMRDIMKEQDPRNEDRPFGGKVIVFGGDFRQILPVIPKGTRQDIVHATINSSPIWKHCKVLRLTKNMRLHDCDLSTESNDLLEFSNWLSAIGDGTLGGDNDGEVEIEIPDDLLITESDNFIKSIVDATYPDIRNHIQDAAFLQGRAILAPTLDEVDKINTYMVGLHDSEEKVYLSSDSICATDRGIDAFEQMHTVEFLNTIKCSGVPNHELTLKEGVPVMLLRNLDHTAGLCNGTRLLVRNMGNYVLEATILGGKHAGEKVFIPRMTLTPSDPRIPFKFQRRQFPLILSYAMTINKSQGQSLSNVGIYLPRKVFSHGQLYVVVSRVTNKRGLKMLIVDDDGNLTNKTTNVVFKEVFQNL